MTSKIKALLNSFYKLAHPDVLGKAPETIQKANTLALSTLNSYIDSITRDESVSLNSLRFYVPREKRYIECKVTLLPFKSNAGPNHKTLHLESVVNSINEAIKSPEETTRESPRVSIPRRQTIKDEYLHSITNQISQEFDIKLRDLDRRNIIKKVSYTIEREYNPFHPSVFGLPSMQSNIIINEAVKNSVGHMLYKSLEKNFVPLDKLFLDEALTQEHINQGLQRLAGTDLSMEELMKLKELIRKINDNEIGIVISNRFSALSVPGFLQLPYNFEIPDLTNFFLENKNTIRERFHDYCNFSKKTDKLLRYISEITVPCTLARYVYKNNPKYEMQSFQECYTALKKTQKLLETKNHFRGLKDAVIVYGIEYIHERGLIQIPTDFKDLELVLYIQNIINGQNF